MFRSMAKRELSLFSYEIMALVGQGGAGGHDLLRMARKARIVDWAGESQYYVEPKRLAGLGYLEAHTEPGRTRPRTVYTLTEKGREALKEWAGTPLTFTPLKSEPLLRLLAADLVGQQLTREGFASLREDIADLLPRLDESEAAAEELPHRREYLLLVNRFLRRYVDLHRELIEEIERELT
jgi:PadR family transcriptional regulator, regulatory protein AphA